VQLADLASESIPPEQNADIFLNRAAGDLAAIQNELVAIFPRQAFPPSRPLTPSEKEQSRKVFVAYPRVMSLLEQAAACPGHAPQIDVGLPPSRFLEPLMDRVAKHRMLARVLRARTALLVSEGHFDEAVASSTLTLRLTRHWMREPLIIGYLTTLACQQVGIDGVNEALQAGMISPTARKALDAELALHEPLDNLRWALRSEQAFSLSSIREYPNAGLWISRGFVNNLQLSFLEEFEKAIQQVDTAYFEANAILNTKSEGPSMLNPLKTLVTLLRPSLDASREATERNRALFRCLRVLNALQAKGAPASDATPRLVDLGLPASATIDPYSGEPLHIKKLPEGWSVYSVGKNLIDDGGTLDKSMDVGIGPRIRDETLRTKLQRDSINKILSNQNNDPPR
jgi:hypothetical protein